MNDNSSYRLNRNVLSIVSLDEATGDRAYWSSQTPLERLRALEYLKQVAYGYDAATARLQRVLTVVELSQS